MSINTRKRTLLSASLLLALGLASTTTQALSPPNIQTNIPWSSNFVGVNAIMAAYNNAHRQEEIQLGLPANQLGNLVLPAQATWDAMSDDAKALYILNAERKARVGMRSGVIGLPLAGVESHVDAVAQAYAKLLHDSDKTGHYQPSGNSSIDNPQNRLNAGVGSSCLEFMTRSENLAYFSASSTSAIGASSIPSPLERAIYNWIYDDAGSAWGHREAALLQDTPLSQPTQLWGYKNNNGSTAHEGFLGFQVIGSTDYTPFGASGYPYNYGVAVVMNIIDPVNDAGAGSCAYNLTTRTEDLPTPTTNRAPVAGNDSATTTAGKAVTISNVLANDSDPDGDTLSVTANTNPANGTVTRSGASFTYTPKAGFTGSDSFTYTVSDGKGGTATGTVSITVNPAANRAPVAGNDSATTTAGKAVTISNVLANDSDPDGDTLSVTANTNPANGTVTRSGASFTYTPKAGFTGSDSFTYTVSDGKGGTATGTVSITVNPAANRAPVAGNDSATTTSGKAVTISNVLANDSDPDGDTLSVTANTNPGHGTVTRSGASFTYTPTAGFTGTDSFSYTVSDGKGGTATGTVTITVNAAANRAPVAGNDSATTTAGKAVTVSNVLANDSDPDGDTLSVTANTNPGHGTVTRSGASFTYTPTAGFTGSDSFTYTVSDGKGGTATGTVSITVNPAANRAPVAVNDSATTTAGKAVTISNVLANDSDPDGDTLSVTANTKPGHGTVTRSGASFTYTPKAGFTGPDSFTYTISDGKGGTATGTVSITVNAEPNNAPVANDDKETGYWNAPIFVSVLDNDTDADGDSLTITKVTKPGYGTVKIQGPVLVYELKPFSRYRGDDTFQYTIKDSKGATATASVTVTILNRIAF